MTMLRKNYVYTDAAGLHFPDAIAGSELFYALDLTCLTEIDKESIVDVVWTADPNVIVVESVVINDTEAQVKLSTPLAGVYKVTATINSLDQGRASKSKFTLVLKVI